MLTRLRLGLLITLLLLTRLLLGLLITLLLLTRMLLGLLIALLLLTRLLLGLLITLLLLTRLLLCLRRLWAALLSGRHIASALHIPAIRVAAVAAATVVAPVVVPAVASIPRTLAFRRPAVGLMVHVRLGRTALVVVIELRPVVAGVARIAALRVGLLGMPVLACGEFPRIRVAPDA